MIIEDDFMPYMPGTFTSRGFTYRVLREMPGCVSLVGYRGRANVLVPPMTVTGPDGITYHVVAIGDIEDIRHDMDQRHIDDGRIYKEQIAKDHRFPLIARDYPFSNSLYSIIVPEHIVRVGYLFAPQVRSISVIGPPPYEEIICCNGCVPEPHRMRSRFGSEDVIIERDAFSCCYNLEEIHLSDRVSSIPEYAFSRCRRLRSIDIRNDDCVIGEGAFLDCEKLVSISLPANLKCIPDKLFCGCGRLGSIKVPDSVTSIGRLAFFDCRALTSLTIPDSVTSIGEKAFQKCLSLRTLVVGDGVEKIENEMFDPFPRIVNLTLGSGIRELEEYCFLNWHNLRNVTLSEGLEIIHDNAFESCDSLESITIPASVRHIGGCVFCCADSLRDIFVREGNTEYSSLDGCLYNRDRSVFILCPPGKVGDIRIPEGTVRIDTGAFELCGKVTSIHVPDQVEDIGIAAFGGCHTLESIRLPEGLDVLGYSMLSECYGLRSIDLGGVREIGQYALAACTSLKEVTIPDSVEEIDRNAFRGCASLETVRIGRNVSFIAAYSFIACPSLKEFIVDGSNPNFMSVDGVVYTKDGKELVLYPPGKEDVLYTLPASVEEVRIGAFSCSRGIREFRVEDGNRNYVSVDGVLYNSEMTELIRCPMSDTKEYTIPGSVEHIYNDAFSCSPVESVVFPEGLTSIGGYAFYNCTSLRSITLPKTLLWIDQRAFYRCTSLQTIHISGLTASFEVMERAFAHCPVGIEIVSDVEGCDVQVFELDGTMLYPLPDEGLRHFQGVLGLMWCDDEGPLHDDDGNLLEDPSERWGRWASDTLGK